jgi:hypothetical protein
MKPKIHLLEELDLIDDCNWGEWACEYSLDGLTWHEGNVQSDGHEIAPETLCDENGHPVASTD